MNSTDSDLILEGEVSSNKWSIRPCHLYKGLIAICDVSFQGSNHFSVFHSPRGIPRLSLHKGKISTIFRSWRFSRLLELGAWLRELHKVWGERRLEGRSKSHRERTRTTTGKDEKSLRKHRLEEARRPTEWLESRASGSHQKRLRELISRTKVQRVERNSRFSRWILQQHAQFALFDHVNVSHPKEFRIICTPTFDCLWNKMFFEKCFTSFCYAILVCLFYLLYPHLAQLKRSSHFRAFQWFYFAYQPNYTTID